MKRQTPLDDKKEQVVGKILHCTKDYITNFETLNETSLENISAEVFFAAATCKIVRSAKRTRDLDKIVQGYFGEDTVEALLNNQKFNE